MYSKCNSRTIVLKFKLIDIDLFRVQILKKKIFTTDRVEFHHSLASCGLKVAFLYHHLYLRKCCDTLMWNLYQIVTMQNAKKELLCQLKISFDISRHIIISIDLTLTKNW